jgi:hypothetical protein
MCLLSVYVFEISSSTFSHLITLTCTASAIKSTPRNIAARPSTPNRISFPPAIVRVDPSAAEAAFLLLLALATIDDGDRSAALLSVVLMMMMDSSAVYYC